MIITEFREARGSPSVPRLNAFQTKHGTISPTKFYIHLKLKWPTFFLFLDFTVFVLYSFRFDQRSLQIGFVSDWHNLYHLENSCELCTFILGLTDQWGQWIHKILLHFMKNCLKFSTYISTSITNFVFSRSLRLLQHEEPVQNR